MHTQTSIPIHNNIVCKPSNLAHTIVLNLSFLHVHFRCTQKTLMDCFRDLVFKSEMDQLLNFNDTLELDTPGTSVS